MKVTDNLLAWEVFVTTCTTGSVTRTSLQLDEEISKVSRLLTDLEAEIGMPLFDKRRRPLAATREGAMLCAKVTPYIRGLRETMHAIEAARAEAEIRLSAPQELLQEYFADLLADYSADNPNVSFKILPAAGVESVINGDVDLAVVAAPERGDGLVVRPYNFSSNVLLASPEYLEKNGTPRKPLDFENHVGLLQDSPDNPPTTELFRQGKGSGPLHWKNMIVSHDQLAIKQLALDGNGIAVDLFAGHCIKEIADGRLVVVMPEWRRSPWRMSIVTRAETENEMPVLALFAKWFAEAAAERMRGVGEEVLRVLDKHPA